MKKIAAKLLGVLLVGCLGLSAFSCKLQGDIGDDDLKKIYTQTLAECENTVVIKADENSINFITFIDYSDKEAGVVVEPIGCKKVESEDDVDVSTVTKAFNPNMKFETGEYYAFTFAEAKKYAVYLGQKDRELKKGDDKGTDKYHVRGWFELKKDEGVYFKASSVKQVVSKVGVVEIGCDEPTGSSKYTKGDYSVTAIYPLKETETEFLAPTDYEGGEEKQKAWVPIESVKIEDIKIANGKTGSFVFPAGEYTLVLKQPNRYKDIDGNVIEPNENEIKKQDGRYWGYEVVVPAEGSKEILTSNVSTRKVGEKTYSLKFCLDDTKNFYFTDQTGNGARSVASELFLLDFDDVQK